MLVKPAPGRFRKDRFDAKLFGKFPAEFNVGPGKFPGGIVVGKRRIDAFGADSQFPGAGNFSARSSAARALAAPSAARVNSERAAAVSLRRACKRRLTPEKPAFFLN